MFIFKSCQKTKTATFVTACQSMSILIQLKYNSAYPLMFSFLQSIIVISSFSPFLYLILKILFLENISPRGYDIGLNRVDCVFCNLHNWASVECIFQTGIRITHYTTIYLISFAYTQYVMGLISPFCFIGYYVDAHCTICNIRPFNIPVY